MTTIPAVHAWPTNGDLIADVARLHLWPTWRVLDATYGLGLWWTQWKPPLLVTNDLYTAADHQYDFRLMAFPDRDFDAVAYDPPYKLNGTPALGDFDTRYGLEFPTRWQDRMQLILDGFRECARVADHLVLAKCQDQVCSGQMRWQTHELTMLGKELGWRLADRFDMLGGGRKQPKNRRQVHARGRGSTLLVFKRNA